MSDSPVDKRKFSGHRVLGECELELPVTDPFAMYDNVKKGYMVLNVRGGCLYLPEHFNEKNIQKIFPDGKTALFKKLTLWGKTQEKIVIENISAAFLRLRHGKDREGLVFRFVDISEKHLDILDSLQHRLPAIGANEESSVPFEEIITLDRGRDFEIMDH